MPTRLMCVSIYARQAPAFGVLPFVHRNTSSWAPPNMCIVFVWMNTLAPNSWRKPNLYNCLAALALF